MLAAEAGVDIPVKTVAMCFAYMRLAIRFRTMVRLLLKPIGKGGTVTDQVADGLTNILKRQAGQADKRRLWAVETSFTTGGIVWVSGPDWQFPPPLVMQKYPSQTPP